MEAATAVLITLIVYKVLLLGIGWFAQRRTKDGSDFFLAGHGLGPLVAAISASASSSSAWTLIGVSGFAYQFGLSALWFFPGCVGGFAVNWYLVAPRLYRYSAERPEALTLTTLLAGPKHEPGSMAIRTAASVIVLFSLMVYVASQFQASGSSFVAAFKEYDLTQRDAVLIGSTIVVIYTLMGGFWAVSLTDTLQGLVMALTAAVLPIAALVAVGGFGGLWQSMQALEGQGYLSLTHPAGAGAAGLGLVVSSLAIAIGYPGQPHVVNRFMALRAESDLKLARRYAMSWALIVYSGMILLGLTGRVLLGDELGDREQTFVLVARELFHPALAGVMVAAVLSAIMSTADSQLLVASSAVSHDLDLGGRDARTVLLRSRLVIVGLSVLAIFTAIYVEETVFNKVLFAWSAMGCAFGPPLLVTLFRGSIARESILQAMIAGFSLSVLFYQFPATRGAIERTVPFVLASAICWRGVSGRA